MEWPLIRKDADPRSYRVIDYDAARAGFDWDSAGAELAGLPGGGLNIAYEAVDRHVAEGRGAKVALRCIGRHGRRRIVTYAELAEETDRCAAALVELGLEPGQTVAVLAGRTLEAIIAGLGVLKAGGVFCPLFAAFGPEPVRARLALGAAVMVVTTTDHYVRKIQPIRHALSELRHVLLVGEGGSLAGTQRLDQLMAAARPFARVPTGPDAPALLHFTSGTTGAPKGAIQAQRAVAAQRVTARLVLDLRDDDVFWCTADFGWVTGTVYGMIAPLACGVTLVVDECEFEAGRWYAILRDERVTVWYTTPTAVRVLMSYGAALARTFRPFALRLAFSVGEPLNPEAVLFCRDTLGVPLHDTWWQTETGAITVANFPALSIKPGSMGRAVPGFDVVVVTRGADGGVVPVADPDTHGLLAVRRGWPSMFQSYLGEPERYAHCFAGEWYVTGDLARCDADGYFWFLGRDDDVIKSAGHLIGPFEIEGTLMDHPAVVEAAVIGRPDPLVNEVVRAFVALNPGFEPVDALRRELIAFARSRLGSALAPREIEFVEALPKSCNGKIMRRLLKARTLGTPEGDVSTLAQSQRKLG